MKQKSFYHDVINTINDYFTFSRIHRRGAMVMLAIIMLLCSGFYIIDFLRPVEQYDTTMFEKQIALFEKNMKAEEEQEKTEKSNDPVTYKSYDKEENAGRLKPTLFSFDPNLATADDFLKLGLSNKQTNVILNYRNKGGQFRSTEDFKKMYCISPSQYDLMKPFIKITENNKLTEKSTISKTNLSTEKRITETIYDINSADAAELDSIHGIGPGIASFIIKYREKLGGFVSLEQLTEVYGMDSALYEKIKPALMLKPVELTKINLNKAFEDEMKHPYFTKQLARLIVNYRKLHGPFKSIEDIRKLALVNDELYLKLAPYLTVE